MSEDNRLDGLFKELVDEFEKESIQHVVQMCISRKYSDREIEMFAQGFEYASKGLGDIFEKFNEFVMLHTDIQEIELESQMLNGPGPENSHI